MKKLITSLAIVAMSLVGLFQATSAAFQETVTVAGTSFSIAENFSGTGTPPVSGNVALKLLKNMAGGTGGSNLVDFIDGLDFQNITPTWIVEVPIKMYNAGVGSLDLVSSAKYISDVNTIRDDIYIEISDWNDENNNGVFESSEEGDSMGYDTILRMKNDQFPLGEIAAGETKGFIMRFDATGVTQSNVGSSAVYDFIFTGIGT